jgi:TP901 family phage tail tape measure protein
MAFRPDIIAGRAVIIVSIQDTIDRELRRLRTTLRRFANLTSTIGGDLFRFGVAGTAGTIFPIKEFIAFQDQLLFLQTKLQVTDFEMKALEATIRRLGQTTSFSPKQVADAATQFAQAGFSAAEVTNSLQAALDLARGGQIDLTTSTTILANALRTFGLGAEYANIAASKFITTARLGTLDLVDLGESLKYSSGTFRTLNVSMDEALALIAQISKSSLKASIAGTSLNTAFQNLAANADILEEQLGITFSDRELEQPLLVFKKINDQLNKLGDRQSRVRALQDIFNIRGARAVSAIIIQDLNTLDDTIKQIQGSMVEARDASIKLDSQLGGQWRRAVSAAEEFFLAIGKTVEGPLSDLLESIKEILVNLSILSQRNPKLAQTLLLLPPALLAASAATLALSRGFGILAAALSPLISLNFILFDKLFRIVKFFGRKTPLALIGIDAIRRLKFTKDLIDDVDAFGRRLLRLFTVAGPALATIRSGFSAIAEGRVELGLDRIKTGLYEVGEIFRTGFLAAWFEFLASLGDVGRTLRVFYNGILSVGETIGTVITAVLDQALSPLNNLETGNVQLSYAIEAGFIGMIEALRGLGIALIQIANILQKTFDFLRDTLLALWDAITELPGFTGARRTLSPEESAERTLGFLRSQLRDARSGLNPNALAERIFNRPQNRARIATLEKQIAEGEKLFAELFPKEVSAEDRTKQFNRAIDSIRMKFEGTIQTLGNADNRFKQQNDNLLQQSLRTQALIKQQDAVLLATRTLQNAWEEFSLTLELNRLGLTRRETDPAAVQVGDVLGQIYLKLLGRTPQAAALAQQGQIIANALGTFEQTRGQKYQPNPVESKQIELLDAIRTNTGVMADNYEDSF